ncbi:MAG TPA: BON domain-containing protein [Candidatus Binatia bacterium]|nr:BON domain-containing protein [Candidatus Binatia bacterium]
MGTLFGIISGTALGLLSMYVLDPIAGRRRRAQARDKLIRLGHEAREAAAVTARDLKNRTLGSLAEARAMIFRDRVDDAVLRERVRSDLGFLVRHPSAIEVQVSQGRVTLIGPVLADEVQQLIRGVESVRGVREVENRLEVHEKPGDVPALQGQAEKPTGRRLDIFQGRWSPSTRFLIAGTGAALLLSANRHPTGLAPLSVVLGAGFLAYGLTQRALRRRPTGATRNDNQAEAEAAGGWTA